MDENKEVVVKKKSGFLKLLYWLVVIGGCIFIFLGSYKIGYKLGNYFGEEKSKTTNKKIDNKESNSNIESNSNNDSNTNSNITDCDNTTVVDDEEKNNTSYTINDLVGQFVSKEAERSISFSTQYTFDYSLYGVPACGGGKIGNIVLNGDKIYAYPLVGTACDTNWQVLNEKAFVITINSKDELLINGKKYTRASNTSLNEAEGGLRYALQVLKEYTPSN